MMIRGVTISIKLVLAADPDVAEEAVDERRLGEDRDAELEPFLIEPLHTAEQHRAAVGDGDRGRDAWW